MGEYADDYFRREVKSKYGFDPGDNSQPNVPKVHCPKCGKRVKKVGLADHLKTVHKITGASHE